jgi:hypothetical protein
MVIASPKTDTVTLFTVHLGSKLRYENADLNSLNGSQQKRE